MSDCEDGPVLRAASRTGKGVYLRPVTDADMTFLFYVATAKENLVRWRLRGRTTSPQNFQQFLWSSTDIQMLVCRQDGDEAIGHVCTYQTDEYSGTSRVAAVFAPEQQRHGWPVEGLFLFLDYLFDTFPFRKLYFEVPDYNASEFALFTDRWTVEEGRLVEAVFAGGQYCDLVTNTLTRQRWNDLLTSSWGRVLRSGLFTAGQPHRSTPAQPDENSPVPHVTNSLSAVSPTVR